MTAASRIAIIGESRLFESKAAARLRPAGHEVGSAVVDTEIGEGLCIRLTDMPFGGGWLLGLLEVLQQERRTVAGPMLGRGMIDLKFRPIIIRFSVEHNVPPELAVALC